MPFISRLKKLDTLPVPELQTTLTVYLITHEHSEETNLVYTSLNPIPADAVPPPDLRYECAEGHTKPGDVLIWASRVHKKACFVHACWVFDGHYWAKPNSNSEIMMDHPVYPDYQLVILSGPYVKWELKPDPDREPSLSIPDPPPARPGARGSINTIFSSSSTFPSKGQFDSSNHNDHGPFLRPRSNDIASDTPDGSAVLCGSSRFSTPLSEIPEDEKPGIRRSESPHGAPPASELCKSRHTSRSHPSSRATHPGSAHTPRSEYSSKPETSPTMSQNFRSASTGGTPSRVHERPKGPRSIPSRSVTPVTGVPPTPQSTIRTRTRRHLRPDNAVDKLPKSSPSPRKRKRQRNVDDNDFVSESSRTPPSASHSGALPPAKRRRLDEVSQIMPKILLKIPLLLKGGQDTPPSTRSSINSDIFGSIDENPSEAKPGMPLDEDEKASWQKMVTEMQRRMQDDLDKAAFRIQQLEEEKAHAGDTALATETALKDQITQLRDERDSTHRTVDNVRAELLEIGKQRDAALLEAKDSRRAADEMATARASDREVSLQIMRQLEDQKKQLEDDLALSKREFEAQRQSRTHQLEQVVGELDEQRRRAANLEVTLRAAQEALHLQRTHAQATEAVQRKTVTQLAKGLKEKDQIAKELADKSEALEVQVEELRKSLLAQDNALQEERDHVTRVQTEMESMKVATAANHLQIADLQATIAAREEKIIAAEDKSDAFQRRVEQILQEKNISDTNLAEEVRIRSEVEAQLLESSRAKATLEEMHKNDEERLAQERAAKLASESKLEAQRVIFQEHLSLTDKERRRLEELLLERCSSLQFHLTSKTRELECAQAEYTKLAAEHSADREQFQRELSASREREEETAELCGRLQVEVKRYQAELALTKQSLEHATLDFTAMKSTLSTERDGLKQELSETRHMLDKAALDSQRELTQALTHRRQVEEELSALRLQFCSQTQDLESANAESLRLKADAKSDRETLMSQLSSMNDRLEEQRRASQAELAAVRKDHESAEQTFQAQYSSLELKTSLMAETLKASQEETTKVHHLLKLEREHSEAELSSCRENLSSLESLLTAANQQCSNAERLLTEELRLKEQTSSEYNSKVKELEDVRADLVKVKADLASAHQAEQDVISSNASLKQELEACKSASMMAEEARSLEQEKFREESCAIANDLKESKAMCLRLTAELDAERESFHVERTLSPDQLRSRLSSAKACLELERATTDSLRKRLVLAEEQSSKYWSDLGSQLLRSLHEAQDLLKIEQLARETLQEELASERLKCRSPKASATRNRVKKFAQKTAP